MKARTVVGSLLPLESGVIPNFDLLLWMIWKARATIVFQGVEFNISPPGLNFSTCLQLDHAHIRSTMSSSPLPGHRGYRMV